MRLVPTQAHLERALGERPGLAGEPVFTLRAFVRDALSLLAPVDARRPAALATARLAASVALEADDCPMAAELPAEPAARVAVAHAVDRALGRLRRAGARPEVLRATGRPRAARLAWMLEAVDAALGQASLFDPRGAGFELAQRIARAEGASAVLPSRARVEGIVAWEADDLAWLEALHGWSGRSRSGFGAASPSSGAGVTLFLPRLVFRLDDDRDPLEPIADMLERRWASLPSAPEIVWSEAGDAEPPFGGVVFASGRDAEARVVARAVLDGLAAGCAPESIALVVPDLDEAQLEPLRAALHAAAIPFCEPRGRPPLGSPEARACLLLLRLAEGPVTRDVLIELLRAPGLHAGHWTESASEAVATARATQLAHRLRDLPVGVDATGRLFVDAMGRATASRGPDAWMARALERMLGSAQWLREAGARRDLCRRYLELLDMLRLGRPSAGELAAALRCPDGPTLAGLGHGSSSVRAVRDAVAELAQAAEVLGQGSRRVTPGELAAEIEKAVAATITQGGASRAGAVRIARPADLCGLGHELTIVTGMTARAYGGSETATDAILDDATALALPAPCRPPNARERSTWQHAELCWAIAGSRRAILTCAPEDERDDAVVPHPLLREADRRIGSRREPPQRLSVRASSIDGRSAELSRLAAGSPPPSDLAPRVAAELERARFFLDPRVAAGHHSGLATPADEAARARLIACVGGGSPDSTVPVTHIERAAGCAFAGFARRVLRIRRGEDLSESADPRERGNLVHRALRAAFEAAAPLCSDPRRAVAAGRSAAERALGLGDAATPLRREAALQAAADATRVLWRALCDRDDPLRFVLAERRFGWGEPAPWGALELSAEGEPPVFVDGQIDRIDRSADGAAARVVDYKTGKPPDPAEHGRTALQLPIYAEAVARALSVGAMSGLYLRVRAGGAVEERPRKLGDRALGGEERAESILAARRAVLSLWKGEVAPRPRLAATCARCDARDVCRRPAVMPVEDEPEERS